MSGAADPWDTRRKAISFISGQPLLRIFDPTDMEVRANVGEPDGAALVPGARALISLDAYPDLVFTARFHSASPVATAPLGSPIKTFTAIFRLDKEDPAFPPRPFSRSSHPATRFNRPE